jgi:hypothetical protein
MTTRNYDCSLLTKLHGDRTAAAFFARQNYLQLQAQPGIGVKVTNPQTGNYDESNLTAMRVGNTTVNAQFFPTKVITPPCACELPAPVGTNFTMPMGNIDPTNGGTQYVNQGINPNPYVMQ